MALVKDITQKWFDTRRLRRQLTGHGSVQAARWSALPQPMNSNGMAITKAVPIAVAICLVAFLPLQLLCATATRPLSSKTYQNVSFEIEPLFGVSIGTLGEYVYTKDTHGEDAKLSELDWDMKPLLYGGMGALFAYKALCLDCRMRFYFPARCGSMTDSDWMNVTVPGAANNRTNYSESDNTLNLGMLFDITAAWRISTPLQAVMFYPFASLEWETIDFSAEDGEGTYADADTLTGNNGQPKKYKKGELMGSDYKRNTLLTWAGLELRVCPVKRLSVTASAAVAPFVYIQSVDTHLSPAGRPPTFYKDKLSDWFVAYRFSTGAAFRATSRISVVMDASYTFSRQLKGDTYSRTIGTSYKRDDESSARADFNHIDISVGARYTFTP